ncbi:fas-binding factor 1 homolog isoform X2 [Amphibalanus amphitrite]|uniref:fas-binding factor 1 homolog isoform X2 n=1 Tax=Amphibalanus amphitrite TaxID=1232801 RepID=UPI001C8FCF1C|nr:fas-binding factor 1 homolog isoform X2 [Amphibalanus amphitrite]
MEWGWGLRTLFILVLVGNFGVITAKLSSHRLCYDKKCEEPVSRGMVLMRYTASEPGMLSVKPNDKVVVYSYPAGDNPSLYGVEVNGRRGYVPKNFIRELKMERRPKRLVEVEPVRQGRSKDARRSKGPAEPFYPYSTEYRQNQQLPRPRVVGLGHDWHHKYVKTLRERQQQQQRLQEEQARQQQQQLQEEPARQQQQQQQQQQQLQEEQARQQRLQEEQARQQQLQQEQARRQEEEQQRLRFQEEQKLQQQQQLRDDEMKQQKQNPEVDEQQKQWQQQQQQAQGQHLHAPSAAVPDPGARQPPPAQAGVDPASFQPADQLLGQHPHLQHDHPPPPAAAPSPRPAGAALDATGGHRGLFGAVPGAAASQPPPPPPEMQVTLPGMAEDQKTQPTVGAVDAQTAPISSEEASKQADPAVADGAQGTGPGSEKPLEATEASPADSTDNQAGQEADIEAPDAELEADDADYPGDNETDDVDDAEEGYDAAGGADSETEPAPNSERTDTAAAGQSVGVGTIEQVGGPRPGSAEPVPPLFGGGPAEPAEPVVPESEKVAESGTEQPEQAAEGGFWSSLGGVAPAAPQPAEPAFAEPIAEEPAAAEPVATEPAADTAEAGGGFWSSLSGTPAAPEPAVPVPDPAAPAADGNAVSEAGSDPSSAAASAGGAVDPAAADAATPEAAAAEPADPADPAAAETTPETADEQPSPASPEIPDPAVAGDSSALPPAVDAPPSGHDPLSGLYSPPPADGPAPSDHSSSSDSAPTDPSATGSTPTDPYAADLASSDPASSDPASSEYASSYPPSTSGSVESPYAEPEPDSANSQAQSAYGGSAYGDSAYGESAYSQSEPEAPGLLEEVTATLLPSSLWGLVDSYSAGHDSDTCAGAGGGARVSVLLSTIGLALTVLLIGVRAVAQFRCDSELKRTISKLHQRLTVYKEETDALKSKLDATNKQLLEGGSAATQAALQAAAADQQAAEEELEEARHQISELGKQVAGLEQELQEAQQLLEEQTAVISTHQSASNNPQLDSMIVETVGKLESDLKQQRKKLMGEIEKLKKDKKKLADELSVSRPLIKQLEAKVTELGSSSRVSAEVEEQHRQTVEELTERAEKETERCAAIAEERDAAAEKLSALEPRVTELESERDSARDQADTLTQEVDALKTMLKTVQDGTDNGSEEKIQALLEGGKLKAQVEKLTKERAKLKEKWKQEREMLKKAQEAEKTLSSELSQLSERCEKAEVDRFEAESKLEHLEKYFQKKELSFQEEMGVLKSRLTHSEGDASSNQGLLVQYEEQIATYRSQVESLKQEIQETERSFRSQIQALEKRAHESWVTCRQAERRLEEANREAQQYRALLTKAEEEKNNLVNGQASLQSFNSNGTGAVSPGPEVDPLADPLLSAAFLPPPPPPGLDPFLAAPPPPPAGADPSSFLPPPLPPLYAAPLPPPDGRYDEFGPRYGRDSPLSERSHRSERGYVSPPLAGRRPTGRDWSPPAAGPRRTLSRSSYSPDRLSDGRGLSPERRRPPLPRYVGGHDEYRGPKTSSPLVQDDYGRSHDKRKQPYDRI